MSHSGKKSPSESESKSLADRLRDSLSCEDVDKPDFRELNLGSPVSPLRTRSSGLPAAATTTTSSSSSSSSGSVTGRAVPASVPRRPESRRSSHSGELSGSTASSPKAATRNPRTAPARSDPGSTRKPLIYSGQSTATSPAMNVLPAGNICPSGRIPTTGMAMNRSPRADVLGSGLGNYGHGSIMRGSSSGAGGGGGSPRQISGSRGNVGSPGRGTAVEAWMKKAMATSDPEEVKRIGNELYNNGYFAEALSLYERAIAISPLNAAYRSNRAAALMGLGRVGEAVKECEEAVRLDPKYVRAHHRLASLFLRLGQVDNARKHLCFPGQRSDPGELQKLQTVEKHLNKCVDARKTGNWRIVLREVDSAIASGADFSPQLTMCRVEAFMKLHQLNDAESTFSNAPKVEPFPISCSQTRFSGMLCEAYLYFVKAKIEMSQGRFDGAVTAAEKASQIDPRNGEVSTLYNNVRLAARARTRGNDLFKSERYTEACSAYAEGILLDSSNSVLYCNRAACWYKLRQWERSIEDCNRALLNRPNYTKALLRRAASNGKLEKWADAVSDYEVLRAELPNDNEVAEALFHAQVALKKSRGEDVHNMKFGGEVEEVSSLEEFRAAVSSLGVSVVHFMTASDSQCKQISPFVDTLSTRYPSLNFLKVDIDKCTAIANAENVRIVPTVKIYKKGSRVKEIVCPSREILEYSVRHYSL